MHLYSKAERNSMIKYFEIWGERTISHSTRGHGERIQKKHHTVHKRGGIWNREMKDRWNRHTETFQEDGTSDER